MGKWLQEFLERSGNVLDKKSDAGDEMVPEKVYIKIGQFESLILLTKENGYLYMYHILYLNETTQSYLLYFHNFSLQFN